VLDDLIFAFRTLVAEALVKLWMSEIDHFQWNVSEN